MFKISASLPTGTRLDADICIVGSGPAGLTLAISLVNAGRNVLILESGMEAPTATHQKLNYGHNSGARFFDSEKTRVRCFGGASQIWGGICGVFDEYEVSHPPINGSSGWPIHYDELKKYYAKAADIVGVNMDNFPQASHRKIRYRGNVMPQEFKDILSKSDSFLRGVHFEKASKPNMADEYRDFFKNSRRALVYFDSTVCQLNVTGDGSTVNSLVAKSVSGKEVIVYAKAFVLAAGTLENPRILLESNQTLTHGIGNRYGNVGAYFMSHPGFFPIGHYHRFKQDCDFSGNGPLTDHQYSLECTDAIRHRDGILRHRVGYSQFNYRAVLLDHYRAVKTGGIVQALKDLRYGELWTSTKNIGCNMIDGIYMSNRPNSIGVGIEQEPRAKNRISLQNKKDQLRNSIIDIHWAEISDREKETVRRVVPYLGRSLGANNLGVVQLSKEFLSGEIFEREDSINHSIGTTRMATKESEGVVDRNAKVFGVKNLYVAGASIFPTASIVHPTYTIIALSIRLADHLDKSI
jgi:choline dehydrogenase-like flavoprotein